MKIIFAGTPQFAATALAALFDSAHEIIAVYTQPDRPAGRGMQLTASPVKQLALQHNVPVYQPVSLRTPEAQQELTALEADLMIVAAYGLILPQAVLETPRYGCLNIHASLLPRWRGAAPIQRAIQSGDKETGITIMQMDVGLDTGDMLLKRICTIDEQDNAQTLHDKLAVLGASSMLEVLPLVEQGQLQPEKQDDAQANYAAKLLKQEAKIDWSLDALTLSRTIRAFNPFPICTAQLGDATVKIWQARYLPNLTGQAGEVLAVDKQGVTIACGQGGLVLEVLQRAGGKAQPVAQFLQAVPIQVGDFFQ